MKDEDSMHSGRDREDGVRPTPARLFQGHERRRIKAVEHQSSHLGILRKKHIQRFALEQTTPGLVELPIESDQVPERFGRLLDKKVLPAIGKPSGNERLGEGKQVRASLVRYHNLRSDVVFLAHSRVSSASDHQTPAPTARRRHKRVAGSSDGQAVSRSQSCS
jgi:hypothetical protein